MNQDPRSRALTPEERERRSNRRALKVGAGVGAVGLLAAAALVVSLHGGGEHADDTITPGFGEPTPTASAPLVPETSPSPTPSETVSATPTETPTPEATPTIAESDMPTAEDQNRVGNAHYRSRGQGRTGSYSNGLRLV